MSAWLLDRRRTALAILVGVLVAANVALLVASRDHAGDEKARDDALRAAEARVPAMFSYSHTSLEGDLAVAAGNVTGAFGETFRQTLSEVVEPEARRSKVETQAAVSAAGVVRGDGSSVTVLVFLTQTTTSSKSTSPVISGSRIEVRMVRRPGGWLVAGLEPV